MICLVAIFSRIVATGWLHIAALIATSVIGENRGSEARHKYSISQRKLHHCNGK
jgi:hypothetical protein